MKQYVGISRDHSGSMASLRDAARKDYNATIQSIKTASNKSDIDTIVSVVSHQGHIRREVVNSGIDRLEPLNVYNTPGSRTPLFDSINELIGLLKNTPDADDKNVSFLVIAVTDGQDNSSIISASELGRKIRDLQSSDRWTFVFRVPRGYAHYLTGLGIPSGNIQEWEMGNEREFTNDTIRTQTAVHHYYDSRKLGATSTRAFFADLSGVGQTEVKKSMADISKEVSIFHVPRKTEIGPYIQNRTGSMYEKGTAFYQLTKTEKVVQNYKLIAIRNKVNGHVYVGQSARDLLNLPNTKAIKLAPGDHGQWDIFIQSTSNNRILFPNTSVLYWPNATR